MTERKGSRKRPETIKRGLLEKFDLLLEEYMKDHEALTPKEMNMLIRTVSKALECDILSSKALIHTYNYIQLEVKSTSDETFIQLCEVMERFVAQMTRKYGKEVRELWVSLLSAGMDQ